MNDISLITDCIGILFLLSLLWISASLRSLFSEKQASLGNTNPGFRDPHFDFIRGISIIGIVAIHIHSYYAFFHPKDAATTFALFLSNLSRFAVPAFVITSGVFLRFRTASSFWKARTLSFVLPYAIVAFLGILIKEPAVLSDPKALFQDLILGKAYSPYYFFPLMLQFYFFYALFLDHICKNRRWVLSILISTLALNFWSNHWFPPSPLWEPISFTNFSFFFLLGIAIRPLVISGQLETIYPNRFLPLLILCLLNLSYIGWVGIQTWKSGFAFSNHLIYYPVFVFLLLYYLSARWKLGRTSHKIISQVGKQSIAIFLIHPILLHLMHARDPFSYTNPWIGYPIILLFLAAFPYVLWSTTEKILQKLMTATTNRSQIP